jgi:predicted RNA-binding Zn-ribbon protein involved in translation (DUF1610 family)
MTKRQPKTLYRFTLVCDKDGEIVHADGVNASFKCPTCGMHMRWDEKTRKLVAHGKEERTIGHKIRVAQELGEGEKPKGR